VLALNLYTDQHGTTVVVSGDILCHHLVFWNAPLSWLHSRRSWNARA